MKDKTKLIIKFIMIFLLGFLFGLMFYGLLVIDTTDKALDIAISCLKEQYNLSLRGI